MCGLLLLLCCWGTAALGQAVQEAEYFWDNDPGQGNGFSLTATDGTFDEAIEAAFANNLTLPSAGSHTFNVRVRDAFNAWGPVYTTVVTIESGQSLGLSGLIQAEYYWDTDPGAGNGTPLLAFDGNFNEALETVFANSVALPATGPHTFNVRVRDSLNQWGAVFTTVLSIEGLAVAELPAMQLAEYFWDTDPGQGNGTALIAFDGNYDEAIEQDYYASRLSQSQQKLTMY